jgi:hypothetical protein
MRIGRYGPLLAASLATSVLVCVSAGGVAAHSDDQMAATNSAQRADWRQFGGGAEHRGWNNVESKLSLSNVAGLQILWTGSPGFNSSPAVANGVVYNGDGLTAYVANCRTDGGSCDPLWQTGTGYPDWSSPAVGGGYVYQQSLSRLYAFKVNCRLDGGTCAPVWTDTSDGAAYSSPAFDNGWLYTSSQNTLQAFDTARCAAAGGECSPDWVADMGGESMSTPAVSHGVVYAVTADGFLEAFAAHCGTGGATCSPDWRADLHVSRTVEGSPSVANGRVYIATTDGDAYAFATGCATGGNLCSPLWKADIGGTHASPAVTDTTVYFVGHRIYAFGVDCATDGSYCSPLWKSGKQPVGSSFASSPAIANGVLYVGNQGRNQSNGHLLAFDANCATDGRTCVAVWRSPSFRMVNSSPAVSHGMVYVSANNGGFYAFGLPPAP